MTGKVGQMNREKAPLLPVFLAAVSVSSASLANSESQHVADHVIADQRAKLAAATDDAGFGPQSPRNLNDPLGMNRRIFGTAPAVTDMTLCDIHFHENAEHQGGQFTTYAGNGDGHGFGTGYKYDGSLTGSELQPFAGRLGESGHGDLVPGDTIEIHFVYSTAKATLGNGLGTCFNETISNPQLRVESVVGVLVNDVNAASFLELTRIEVIGGLNQLPNLPADLGTSVIYAGSTTGPGYNEEASPYQVTWSVRPNVLKIDINTVAVWLADNPFEETHAHGVRNLVTNPDLLSQIDDP